MFDTNVIQFDKTAIRKSVNSDCHSIIKMVLSYEELVTWFLLASQICAQLYPEGGQVCFQTVFGKLLNTGNIQNRWNRTSTMRNKENEFVFGLPQGNLHNNVWKWADTQTISRTSVNRIMFNINTIRIVLRCARNYLIQQDGSPPLNVDRIRKFLNEDELDQLLGQLDCLTLKLWFNICYEKFNKW